MTRVLIVCGGRDYLPDDLDWAWLQGIVQALEIDTIRHGAQRGVDIAAGAFALRVGLDVDPVPAEPEQLDAKGRRFGKRAFPVRNRRMLTREPRPVATAALIGGPGTLDMITATRAQGLRAIESPRRRQ
jgi:hypothetical protein